MSDLFHQSGNKPAPKAQGRAVPWFGLTYEQCLQSHPIEGAPPIPQQIINHICNLKGEKASNYAKFLVQNAGFPLHFFNDCPNVILKFN